MSRQPRKFSDLRDTAKQSGSETVELAKLAFNKISSTAEGHSIREFLSSVVYSVTPTQNKSAWRENEARRLFAEELLQMMDGENDHRGSS